MEPIEVNNTTCKGCGTCGEICPRHVLEVQVNMQICRVSSFIITLFAFSRAIMKELTPFIYGGNTSGDFCQTLNVVDVKSGWTDPQAVKNKAQVWVFEALEEIRERLPFALKGIDSDNGGEFINAHLFNYCEEEGIDFTRGRSSHKNDNCYVEEKNFTAVRNYVGHYRYDNEQERALLNELYSYLRLYLNYFQPLMKLKSKERIGSKVIKKYDQPKTPYQRLLEMEEINEAIKSELKAIYKELNPFELKRNTEKIQNKLFKMVYLKRKQIYSNKKNYEYNISTF